MNSSLWSHDGNWATSVTEEEHDLLLKDPETSQERSRLLTLTQLNDEYHRILHWSDVRLNHKPGSSLQDTQAGCKSHKKSHYCLSQDPKEEEEEGSRYERDLLWGSRGTGFKGWCWHLQTVDIKYCLSLFNYFNMTCPVSWKKLCLASLALFLLL